MMKMTALTASQRDLYRQGPPRKDGDGCQAGFCLPLGQGVERKLWTEAVRQVVAGEDITRTRMFTRDGDIFLGVDATMPPHFEFVNLDRESAWDRLQKNTAVPLDLHQGPLVRNYLFEGQAGFFTAGLVASRLIFDALSSKLFFKRVFSAYRAFRNGRLSETVTAPSFYDYAKADNPGQDAPDTLEYWRAAAASVEALEFSGAADRETPNTHTRLVLNPDEVSAIKGYCAANRLSLPAFFLTAYACLLQRYADHQGAFLLHATTESRPRRYARTIGCFFRIFPVVLAGGLFAAEGPASALMVSRALRAGVSSGRVSVDALRAIVGEHPVRCFFDYRPGTVISVFGRQEVVRSTWCHPAEEIHLGVTETGGSIALELSCNPVYLHEARFLDRLLHVFRQLRLGVNRWGDLDIILEDERRRTEVRGAGLDVPQPPGVPFLERFREQASARGEEVAVVCEGRSLTYRQLDESSRRLAARLRAMGVGPEHLVALCLERSLELVVAILGILRAGGAYVPIDPVNPDERIRFLLDDCGAQVLVTESRHAGRCSRPGVKVICVDRAEEPAGVGVEVPAEAEADIDLQQAAYVIYTSGSTGRPKGVVVTHANLARLFSAAARWFDFGPEDVWAFFHSCAFDVSVWELWGALLHGGRLVIVPGEAARSPVSLLDLLSREGVTVLNQTPSAFFQLDRADQARGGADSLSLRYVIFAGETLHFPALRNWIRRRGHEKPKLFNLYGITETTVYTTCHPLTGTDIEEVTGSVIGVPLDDLYLRILDSRGRPVPPGLTGELWVGGAGVARGYLGRPELTARRFVPEPANGSPEARLYRSGDRVRLLPDGNLEFLGRLDHQVKVRGFRVEPGEIETVLLTHPAIREAVVTPRDGGPEGVDLVAYAVTEAGRPVAIPALRRFLSARLPGYMIPARFVFLEALPLTANGKVDRRKLPELDRSRPALEAPYTAPRTEMERILADIWRPLLRVEQIGIHDNFFDLGGHSLAAAQLMARVNEALKTDLPLRLVFSHPTIAALAVKLTAAGNGSRDRQVLQLEAQPRTGRIPCSFSQERVWFLMQMAPQNRAYDSLDTIRFSGPLEVAVLERSLSEIIQRHEIYRTTFTAVEGKPGQVIHEPWPVKLTVDDLRHHPAAERPAEEARLIGRAIREPFRLDRLPLVRWSLVRTDDEEYTFIHFEHHIVHDGWSFVVFLRELLTLYRAFAAGRPSPLTGPEIQFADFAIAQRRWMTGPVRAAQLAYWKETLRDAPPLLGLATDHPRPPLQTFAGRTFRRDLPPALSAALGPAARAAGVTVFVILLSAFFALLHRHTDQEDIVVGSGVANRRWRRSEGLLGMIINNLALRCRLSGDPSFRELVRRVKATCLGALENQDVPFDAVVEELNPLRSPSHTPLFQAFFTSFDGEVPDLELPGIRVAYEEGLSVGAAKFDLNVIAITRKKVRVGEERLGASETTFLIWEFNTDLFDEEAMQRMLDQYIRLLQSAVADPDIRISNLPLLTAEERAMILAAGRGQVSDYPRHQGIHEVFEEVARSRPGATAVCRRGTCLSYGELNERANRLAHVLRRAGVGPGTPVGLCLERDPEMVVATLGILKAGGAYVPLDPSFPRLRLAYMLNDTQAPWLVTRERLLPALPEYGGRTVCLDRDRGLIQEAPTDNLAGGAGPDSLAYIMYTSGSTGVPKGVCVPHRGVVRLVKGVDYVNLSPAEVLLQLAPISFDAATFEIWGALLNGGRLVIPSEEKLSLRELGEVIRREGVTTLWLTAPLFHQLAEEHLEGLRGVRQLVAGGDVLSADTVRRVLAEHDGCVVVNGYGPTECTTFTCCQRMADAAVVGERVPIGRPIANTQVYILDRNRRPVPVGVAGELYIGGDGLARGYWNAPDLTAERFVEDPFSGTAGGRLYRSGDLARYLANGAIEFRGRIDNQVKIRGFRIEPQEVEAALRQHPGVSEAVVLVSENPPGEKRLAAYVVLRDPCSGYRFAKAPFPAALEGNPTALLRRYLKERLPDFMLPSALLVLPEMPRTPTGKINRSALPLPERTRDSGRGTYVAPRDELEVRLAEVWENVLEIKPVGIRENFFELGGHSLLAVRLVWEIEKTIGAQLPLKVLFRFTTVEEMAAAIRDQAARGPLSATEEGLKQEPGLPPEEYRQMLAVMASGPAQPVRAGSLLVVMNEGGSNPPLFWCFNSPGFELPALSGYLGPDQPLYGLYSGSGVLQWSPETPELLANHYIEEIRSRQPKGPYLIGGNCAGARVGIEIALRLTGQGEVVRGLCLMEHFDPRLFRYPGRMLLLYGRESHLRAYEPFRWLEPGWEAAFRAVPEVDWIPGPHGQFFQEPNLPVLARKVSVFLREVTRTGKAGPKKKGLRN